MGKVENISTSLLAEWFSKLLSYSNECEEEVDLRQFSADIRETDKAIRAGNETQLGELTFADAETKAAMEEFVHV